MNRACSDNIIDLEAFKKSTNFGGNDELEEKFWEVVEGFTNKERQMLIKFMCGRTRLQQGSEQYIEPGYRSDDSDDDDNPVNQRFPVGHTCGNSMDLPNYTSAKIMRERLLVAISLCGEIDDDGEYMDYDEEVNSINNDMNRGVDEG